MNNDVVAIIEEVLNSSLSSQEGLLDNGVLDSLMTMQVIEKVEEKYDIQLDPEDFTHENFNSVSGICEMINRYK